MDGRRSAPRISGPAPSSSSQGSENGKSRVPVTNDLVATLRALLTGDHDQYERGFSRLATPADHGRYAALLAAAFTIAAERHFSGSVTRADLIRYVADVRARVPSAGENIEPKVAEQLLYEALTDDPFTGEPRVIGMHQMILLAALISDAQLTPIELDAFLADARVQADEWIAAEERESG